MGNAALMAVAMNRAGRAPSIHEFFGMGAAPRGGRFHMQHLPGGRVRTSEASTAEDFDLMVKTGWAVKAEA